MGRLGKTLSGMDFYRRVPKELTEATMSGSALSISCLVLMVMLFVSELRGYLRVETRSEVVLDDVTDGLFQISFNMTLPRLSCEWVRVDVHDSLGHDRINVTTNIRKFPLGKDLDKASERSVYGPGDKEAEVAHGEIRELHMEEMDRKDGKAEDNAVDVVGADALKVLLGQGEITLVNYFAPWCPWCQKLHPVWEHVAGLVKKEYGPTEINMARVDCTDQRNSKVCQDNFVQAYPTIRVYRRGISELVEAPPMMMGGVELHGQEHESFHGDRTVEALVRFAENTIKDNKRRKLEGSQDNIKPGYQSRGGSEVLTNGCMVEGVVVASRVPGTLELVPRSASHSFDGNLINLTHVIHHLHFEPASDDDFEKLNRRGNKFRDAFWNQMPLLGKGKKRVMKAKPGERRLDDSQYQSNELLVQHEHYIKVVAREHVSLRKRSYSSYEYTASSNGYVIPHAEDLRGIRFSYDISPVKVRTVETSRSLFQFLTGLCAIIGGVYTVFGLLDGATLHTLKILKKDKMGKLG